VDKSIINLFHQSVFAMNTQLDVVFWGNDASVYEPAYQTLLAEVENLENTISRYRPDAELYRLNQSALNNFVEVSETLWDTIVQCVNYHELTKGYFNVALGKVFQDIKSGQEPQTVIDEPIFKLIAFDEKCHAICFLHADVLLDFGGMGKGMALNKIGSIIDDFQISNAFISFGGSSVLTRGSHPYGNYWPFGLAGDDQGSKEWRLNNDSISVSKTTRQIGQKIETHIVDPTTLQAVFSMKTAVVQAKNPIHAEILSTALLASPSDVHDALVRNFEVINHLIF
jgi:FAD:protein FMN transferase